MKRSPKRKFYDTEQLVPYRQAVGSMIQDRWANTHQFFELVGPPTEAMSTDRLKILQAAQVAALEALPDEIIQIQFSYSTCGDYREEAKAHGTYSSDRYELLNYLRIKRAAEVLERTQERKLVKPRIVVVLSCGPRESDHSAVTEGKRGKASTLRDRLPTAKMTQLAQESLALARSVFADVFGALGFQTNAWTATDVAKYLHQLWNPVLCQDVGLRYDYETTPFNDAWLIQDWELLRDCWSIGCGEYQHYHGFVSLTEEPQETRPRIIEEITTNSPVRNINVVQSIRRTDRSRQASELRFQLQKSITAMKENRPLYDRIFDPNSRQDPSMQQYNVEEAERAGSLRELLSDLMKGVEFQVQSQLVIHTWAKTKQDLEKNRRTIMARLAAMSSARASIESFPTLWITQTSLPGSCEALLRWRKVRSRMASDLTPISVGLQTDEPALSLFETSSGGLVTLDLFSKTNVSAPLVMVSGGSGQGKSFLVNQLLIQHIVGNTLVFIVDVGGSYARLVELLGGSMLKFDPSSPFCFNPFQVYGSDHDGQLRQPTASERARIVTTLETLLIPPDEDRDVLPIEEHNLLDTAVDQLFADAVREGRQLITITDLARKFSRLPGGDVLATRLMPFTAGKEYGAWLDGPTNVDMNTEMLCFDLLGIQKDPRLAQAMTPIIINYIHEMVVREPERRKVVILDELWKSIANENLRELVFESFKTFRKMNSVVIGATQSIGGDIADSPVAHAIIDNTQTWFLLNQGEHSTFLRTCELLDLNEGQAEILANIRTKTGISSTGEIENYRGCLMKRGSSMNDMKSGELRIRATPYAYWVATTDPDDIGYFKRTLRANDGDLAATLDYLAERCPFGLTAQAKVKERQGEAIVLSDIDETETALWK